MTVIAFVNPKGGAGKTSAVASLAHTLTARGLHVLAVDLDDSCALTYGTGRTKVARDRSIGAVLVGQAALDDIVIPGPDGDLAPANDSGILLAESVLLPERAKGLRKLAVTLAGQTRWDVILLDTPGRLGTLQMGAVIAAGHVIIPVSPRRDHVLAAQRAIELVHEAHDDLGAAALPMLLRTLVEKPHAHSTRAGSELTGHLAGQYQVPVLRTVIPAESKFTEAEFQFRPIGAVQPGARTAIAYRALAEELAQLDVVRTVVAA